PQINNKHILPYPIYFPTLPEQTAIGSFFQDIDQLISLQQRKLEVLKEQKKTYLKLLFPAKGQTKPALRFAGFEDEWKEVKLGEVVASERKGKAKSEMIGNKSVYLDTIYLNGGEQTRVDCDCDTSKEDIIILWDGSQAGAVYYGFEGALGSTLKSYKIFGSGSFYYQQMKASQSLIFERYRTPNIPHVIKSFLDDFYIFTTSLPEQEAIGSFFQDLDKAIAKQEEKVNQLKESKQTLLRKMFI
uniref:restriction endonuclease subunit S n=1 Tax=Streptococcus vestibularis TaxID=1343 RepID=UPI0026DF9179